jgi:hypothetical protein
MASGLVQVERQAYLTAMLGGTTYPAPTAPIKVALVTVTGTTTTAGTEVTGGSYARQSLGTVTPTAAAPSVASNPAIINFTGMPVATVTGVDIYDSTGTPVRKAFGDLTASKTTASGDTLSFAIAALSINL